MVFSGAKMTSWRHIICKKPHNRFARHLPFIPAFIPAQASDFSQPIFWDDRCKWLKCRNLPSFCPAVAKGLSAD
ncbi:MAG: hypothetical protein M0P70_19470 [Desulfobulbaceae bacterium]|nr:hypothetical protein [Desulfobulbaceae bacterium]